MPGTHVGTADIAFMEEQTRRNDACQIAPSNGHNHRRSGARLRRTALVACAGCDPGACAKRPWSTSPRAGLSKAAAAIANRCRV
jgi:hypothetical protein